MPNKLDGELLLAAAHELLDKVELEGRQIRIIGLSVSQSVNTDNRHGQFRQLIFDD